MSRQQETKDDDRRRTNELRADAVRYLSDRDNRDKEFGSVVTSGLLGAVNGHDYPAKD